jgi:hypothetical protein
MKFLRLLALAPFALASPASAAGIDLAWDSCLGEPTATSIKTFACNTSLGTESLWISFESPITGAPAPVEVAIEFRTRSGEPLPVWWDFEDVSSCRRGALYPDTDPPNATPTCAPWDASEVPAFVIDRIDYQLPTADVGRMVVSSRRPGSVAIGQRYLACRLLLTHVRSTGVQACAGCQVPVRVTLNAVSIASHIMTNPITQNFVLWQDTPVPTRASSWSALKSLYK